MQSSHRGGQSLTPEDVFKLLQEGNERFLDNPRHGRILFQIWKEPEARRKPLAAVLSCSDMNMSPELIFDQGMSDIFNIRLAGHAVCADALGSLEYACASLGSKLIVVLGHTHCSTVEAACDDISFGSMAGLTERLRLSILAETETLPEGRHSKNKRFVKNVARQHILRTMEHIIQSSSIIRELIEQEDLNLVGAMYGMETGKITFMGTDGRQMLASLFPKYARQNSYW